MTGPKGIEGFEKLSPAKQKLLLARMEEARRKREAAHAGGPGDAGIASGDGVPRSPRREQAGPGESPAFPLSFSQRRLWFLDRLEPGGTAFVLIDALRLSGHLVVPALAAALSEIVRRHEALRTVFEELEEGEPVQRVMPPRPVELPLVDLAGLPRPLAEAELRRAAEAEVRRPFDVPRGPHLRALLLRLAPEEHGALLCVHHIVSDAWSLGVLVRELTALYAAYSEGRAAGLPELPVQYPDFADWQRGRLSGDSLERLLGYWKEQLAGAPFVLELPADRPRPAVQTQRGASVRTVLPPDLMAAAARTARSGGETLFMVLLAAYGALLSRHAGQDDLLVGSPVANRNRLELEGLIGFFVNMLALRVDLRRADTAESFAALLERVRRTTLGAYAHQDLPFERLVEELQPVRDRSRTPLFQATLTLQNAPAGELRLPGLSFSPLPVELEVAQFDLGVEAVETPDGLILDWRFNADLFDAGTVERMANRFPVLLGAATAQPEGGLDELPLLSDAERRQVLSTGDATVLPPPEERRLHDLFAAAAAAAPHAEAVVDEALDGERLTYAELAGRAARLARRLIGLGVVPEVPVAVCLPRTVDTVVSFLAVVQAGGVHVPLDPLNPEARRVQLLRGCGARLLISRGELAAAGEAAGVPVVDPGDGLDGAGPVDGVDGGALASQLAYLIYTSGSTGEPKGVAVEHGPAVVHVEALARAVGMTAADRVLLFASYGFDVSVEQFWATLASGATLVLRGDGFPLPERFSEYLVQRGVTFTNMATAYWHQWVATGTVGAASTLRGLMVGGEAMSAEAARLWRDTGPAGSMLINSYGPTETVVTPAFHRLAEGEGAWPAVPVGRTVGPRPAHVVDRLDRLVPDGVVGELLLGGLLARGYLGRPALTAERFVPDPFAEAPGCRLYRSGDLVKRRPDGVIEYLGRIDFQVKVRGVRIELGEVEAALASHPGVRQAAVIAEPGHAGNTGNTLVAYVVPEGEAVPPPELRAFLGERLPSAFVPSAFVTVPALPLTPNGKVDRRRLAALAAEPGARDVRGGAPASRPPRTPAEEIVAAVWEEVLGRSPGTVGADDDFFDAGGHSLLATQVVSRLGAAFGVDLPLRALFDAPTVAALAARLEREPGAGGAQAAPAIVRTPRDGRPLPLSFSQQRLWFLDRLEPGSPLYNMPVALRLVGDLDPPALAAAFAALAARHEALRTTFADTAAGPAQEVHPPAVVALPLVDLSGLPEERRRDEAGRLASQEAERPFDLRRGPLWRASLLRIEPREHALVVTLHHAISDGWSMGILTRETVALYAGTVDGLPELPVQYADFAVWQREWLQGEVLAREVAHWRERLAGAPPLLELPTDRPRPPVQTFRGATVPAALSAEVTAAAAALARRTGATLFMALLAGFEALLARYSGQLDLCVGTPVAGRNRVEIEGLIGFFVNTLVLRGNLVGEPGFRELLGRARDESLAAFAHQDVPFEKLVEELKPERSLAHAPLFQVLLALQNAPLAELEVPGLSFRPLVTGAGTSRFDLSLSLGQTAAGLEGSLEYRTDLFDAATVHRLLERFERLLGAALAEPDRPVAELPLLTAAEERQLLELGRGGDAVESQRTLGDLFRASVERDPEAVAVVSGGERVTYGELAARAGELAALLREIGIGPEARVGIGLDRSVDLVAAILAVVVAGGAWVPLDPAVPAGRLEAMAREAGLAAVVVSAETAGKVPVAEGVEKVFVGDEAPSPTLPRFAGEGAPTPSQEGTVALSRGGGARPGEEAGPDSRRVGGGALSHAVGEGWGGGSPEHLAYVIFTSGSTGQPKGVMVTHGGLANLAVAQARLFGIAPGSRVLQFASPGFDASVSEIAMTLAAGATLVVESREALIPGPDFARRLRELEVTHATLPPSALAVTPAADLPALRCLIVAGEECPPALAARWSDPERKLFDAYGPTEGTVCATAAEVADPAAEGRLPIGGPLPGVEAHLFDAHWQPVPAGIPGELWIGGAGLARGYLGRPDLTAERFVPHPYGAPGARLYRTGDLARRRPDGALEFLGRIDHQLKVRGVRVEPGEVEALLAGHEAVRQAVVEARPGPGGALRLVAWFVPADGVDPGALPSLLRSSLRERLPEAMVPAAFVAVSALPATSSGKVDRAALREPAVSAPSAPSEVTAAEAPPAGLEQDLAAVWKEVLSVEAVGLDDNFFDLGGHSLLLAELQDRIRLRLGIEVALLDLFRFPNVRSLARHVQQLRKAGAEAEPAALLDAVRRRPAESREIAIVGMAGRFPGAADLEQLWENLRSGVESVRFFSPEELRAAGVDPDTPGLVPASGVLDRPDFFDAPFFDMSPREAQLTDPQHRVFLEVAAEALDRGGYGAGSPSLASLRVGVFAGSGPASYALQNLMYHPAAAGLEVGLGNEADFLATRVAYKLDLRGPALTVQTACSTSLVAVHLACKSLLDGECDLALAGGVTINFPQVSGYVYQDGGVSSRDGHNRAFDVQATGTVGGNGAGAVLLKPLAAALADGDVIHAVIKATALNNDGAGKVGFTAPSEEGQARVIAEAQALAGVHPDSIRYVEAHGSATPLGDPIEVAALTRAFRAGGSAGIGACAVGSVKTNFGHAGSAAGIAGLLKAVLAIRHREIPPSLHFETPNPRIDFASSPFYVPTALEPWESRDGVPRHAGVSSFGLGGTNIHAVLEEAPSSPPEAVHPGAPGREWQLLTLSARTPTALEAATDDLAAALPGVDLADAAWTLHLGRKAFEHRRVLVCRETAEAAAALAERDPQRLMSAAIQSETGRPVAFVFSGLGEQYPGMAAGLYRGEPAFREAFDACAEAFLPRLGEDLRALLFPAGQEQEKTGGLDLKRLLGRGAADPGTSPLDRTRLLQPALFALEYALARLWREWGIVPQALIGYSLGEYVAACLAGVLSLDDAIFLVAERARLVDELPEGAMLAVSLPEEEIGGWLEGELGLAAVNGPRLSVVAGPLDAVAALEERLAAAGHATRRLRTTHAFHCAMMRPAAERLAELARRVELRAPAIPYVSNVTGTWITPEQATDPAYWAEHLCATVRFGDGLGELWREPGRVLLEIGPGGSLSALALQHPATEGAADPVAVASLPSAFDRQPDAAFLLGTLGKLWLAGVEVDWRGFHGGESHRRAALPPYPFERRRYWVEAGAPSAPASRPSTGVTAYLPAWRRTLPPPAGDLAGRWLIFADAEGGGGLGARLATRLERAGAEAVLVSPGERFEKRGPGHFVLDPARGEDYAELLWALDGLPDRVVHLWSLDIRGGNGGAAPVYERGFLSLLSLVHALALRAAPGDGAGVPPAGSLRALIVTAGLQRVTAADPFRPELAPLLALTQALPLEMPGVVCRGVDADRPAAGSWQEEKLVDALLAELVSAEEAGEPVAWRGGERWVRSFEPVSDAPETALPAGAVLRLDRPDEAALRAAVEEARGPVAAAVVALGLDAAALPLPLLRRDEAEAALAEAFRRLETLAGSLERLDAERRPGRIVLLTSLESYAPEPGAALRAAVQQLAAAFCEERFAASPVPWTAVAWDPEAGPLPDTESLGRLLAAGPVARLAVSAEVPEAWRRRAEAAVPADPGEGLGLHARPSLRNPYVAPRSETEQAVVDTWRRLLGLEQVGVHDSFFDLGGDSLLATQVMTRIREGFGVQVPLPEFFERPTPAALAERIEASGPSQPAADIAGLIAHLEDLSPEEVERMLAERGVSLEDLGE